MEQDKTWQLLRVPEFAQLLGIKESTVKRLVSSVHVGRRAIRVPASEVDRLIREGTTPAGGKQR